MNYTKPEAVILGEAGRVIELNPVIKGFFSVFDTVHPGWLRITPAYDLDE